MQPSNRFDSVKWMLMAAMVVMLTACGGDKDRSISLGKYEMNIKTDPSPLQVGQDAELTVRFKKTDEALNACHLAFRQFMPEHQMDSDHAWHEMEHLGKGLFRGRGVEFTMGGDWQLEFKLDCGGTVQLASATYNLEWPE